MHRRENKKKKKKTSVQSIFIIRKMSIIKLLIKLVLSA